MALLAGAAPGFAAARKDHVVEEGVLRIAHVGHFIFGHAQDVFDPIAVHGGIAGGHADHVRRERGAEEKKPGESHATFTGVLATTRRFRKWWYIRRSIASTGMLRKMPATPPISPPA